MIETPGGHFVIPVNHTAIAIASDAEVNAAKE